MVQKYAQDIRPSPTDPNQVQVAHLSEQIQTTSRNILVTIGNIVTTINLLISDKDYGPTNQALLSTLKNRYMSLMEAIEGGVNFDQDIITESCLVFELHPCFVSF